MRTVNFFIPHYGDHERLLFQLSLCENYYNFPRHYIIYDSSPNPIGKNLIENILSSKDFTYKELNFDLSGNTYPYVLRDFMISDDSNDGAFIMPHDEFIYINYDQFNIVPKSIPFSCGHQLSFCPTTKKVAEFSSAHINGYAVAQDHRCDLFNPQYHATYFPGHILKLLGSLYVEFVKRWGGESTPFLGFVQFDLLRRLNTYYSTSSIYFQEKLVKRKSTGQYLHPSVFVQKLNLQDRSELIKLVNEFWHEIITLSTEHNESAMNNLFNLATLKASFLMTHINSYKYLFKFVEDQDTVIAAERIDIFCAYHSLSSNIDATLVEKIFGPKTTILCNDLALNILKKMIYSYSNDKNV